MAKRPPKLIALDHDGYHAQHVGRTSNGRQCFLTTPFVPAVGDEPGREFLALYVFDEQGQLLEARVEDLGTRLRLDTEHLNALRDEMLASLGEFTPGRIRVAPFQIERFGVAFGFIASRFDPPDDGWRVAVEPGDYMAFFAPWDSGIYDT